MFHQRSLSIFCFDFFLVDLTVQHTGDEADAIRVENLENQTITIQSVGDIHVHNLKVRQRVHSLYHENLS